MWGNRREKEKILGVALDFLLLLPSLSNFEICVALITVNLHWDTVNMKSIFFLTLIVEKKKVKKNKFRGLEEL